MKKYNLPILLLGGGGYTIRNVARCWTLETSYALGIDISNDLPYNDYFEYFGPDFKLNIQQSNMTNQNTPEYMDKMKVKVFENLRYLGGVPSVQMTDIAPDAQPEEEVDEDSRKRQETRVSIRDRDKRIVCDEEFSESEDEGAEPGLRKHNESYKESATARNNKRPRMNITQLANPDNANAAPEPKPSTPSNGQRAQNQNPPPGTKES